MKIGTGVGAVGWEYCLVHKNALFINHAMSNNKYNTKFIELYLINLVVSINSIKRR